MISKNSSVVKFHRLPALDTTFPLSPSPTSFAVVVVKTFLVAPGVLGPSVALSTAFRVNVVLQQTWPSAVAGFAFLSFNGGEATFFS